MNEDRREGLSEHIQREMLLGRVPRHQMDVRLGAEASDARYEEGCEAILTEARAASQEICSRQERHCPELSALEDAGLSERIRYLTTIACVAAAVDHRLTTDGDLDLLAYLKTAHRAVQSWRSEATYDLSNLLGPLRFLPIVGRNREDILGFWIWLNLGDTGDHRHLTWVKSSMRFAAGYGEEVLRRSGPASEETDRFPRAEGKDDEHGVSRETARRIAEEYLVDNEVPRATGEVSKVLAWDEIDFRRPNTYGRTDDYWRAHWIVYLEQAGMALRESLIMTVHRRTGEVDYVGGAGDEG